MNQPGTTAAQREAQQTDPELEALLARLGESDPEVISAVFTMLIEDIRARARKEMASYRPQTLQPTALVNEAYIKLVSSQTACKARSQGQFLKFVSRIMERVMIDVARHKQTQRAGGNHERVPLTDAPAARAEEDLGELEAQAPWLYKQLIDSWPVPEDRRLAEMKRMGMSRRLIAEVMELSTKKVERRLKLVFRFLKSQMLPPDEDDTPTPA